MTPSGRWHYQRIGAVLLRRGLLKADDYMQLSNLAEAFAALSQARKMLAKLPIDAQILTKLDGRLIRNPLQDFIRDQVEVVNKLAARFGIDPASRARLDFDGGSDAVKAQTLEQLLAPAAAAPRQEDDDIVIQ